MGGLRWCPPGARVNVFVCLCIHGWIERVSIRCPVTCVNRSLRPHGWIERLPSRCRRTCFDSPLPMGGLRVCPSGARVHLLVGLCLHGWIERVSIRGPGTCVSRSLPTWLD